MALEVVLGLAVAIYALYYLCFVGKEPEVYHCSREGSVAARLARDLPILKEKFWPTPGLDNTHLQTLLGVVGRRRVDIEFETECFPLADGGELYVDWTVAAKDPMVTCVILHGTQGSSRSRYIRHVPSPSHDSINRQFLRKGVAQNWRCVVLHQRGCGASPSESVPVRVVEDNENIIFGLTDRGGHLAWLEGWDFWEEAWMDRAVVQFSKALWNQMPKRRLQKIHTITDPTTSPLRHA
ncbi:abhydrolase domain containing protein 3, putative [Acanthamoeba castellanii str. Neff]|uniref:Abhydrolase domain containing protein 3, putative n=1 Tax=Acanthamoeba castellanii (strain ATCC 30010 / Neff) TaxID=1257118 RepID=L8H4T5_ACACF|nr:abhydrolase domain containing protein 3, putative [Acanthamoeba castellanii str. Neff]ELR19743.1 abhydrolase domain containing protein 3, putative [Acanthamoeba castellanii str. Neff]